MTAYRFCRTDDMGLLVAAYEACRGPEDAGAPALDLPRFKRLVREIDLWCSSSMVALEGREPVGVLLGAKRAAETLVYGLRVHPDHRRKGHGRHLLTSLGQKLAILGPPRLLAEVPLERAAACGLFAACGWREAMRLTDWRREGSWRGRGKASLESMTPVNLAELRDLRANGLLWPRGGCWERDLPSLEKQAEVLRGLAFHSADGVDAWVLYRPPAAERPGCQILRAGLTSGPLGEAALEALLDELSKLGEGAPFELARVGSDELDDLVLRTLGFKPGTEHVLFATEAKAA